MNLSEEIRFDGWTLRRRTGELQKARARVRLQSQPLHILEELLSRPGELVTRGHLIARLWPHGVVDFDTALNSAVRRLRTALDDRAETPRYIETIPRRGYRFIGRLDAEQAGQAEAVKPLTPAPASEMSRRPWSAAVAAMAVLAIAMVAYLLFPSDHEAPADPAQQAADNPEAREVYLRAEHFFQRRAAGDLVRARRYYEEALAIDPGFAEAWAGIASVNWIDTVEGRMPPEQGLSKVRDAAERALELNPRLAVAHVRLANYRRIINDIRGAEEHMQKALALEPENPLMLASSASMAAAQGRFAEAVETQRRAVEAAPLSQANRYNLGVFLFYTGRYAEAEREMIELRELSPTPQNVPELHGLLLVVDRRFHEALAVADDWEEGADRLFIGALAHDGLGRRADADAALQALIELRGSAESFRIAEVYAHRGDADRAFEWLQVGAVHAREARWRQSIRRPLWLLDHSPFLRPLQKDPRWEAWHTVARQPWQQAAGSAPPSSIR